MKTRVKVLLLITVIVMISLLVTFIFKTGISERWEIYNLTVDSRYAELLIDDSQTTGLIKRKKEPFILNIVSNISESSIRNYLKKSNSVIKFSINDNNIIDARLYFIKNKELFDLDSKFINILKNGEEVLAIIEYKSLFKDRNMVIKFSDEFIETLGNTDIR